MAGLVRVGRFGRGGPVSGRCVYCGHPSRRASPSRVERERERERRVCPVRSCSHAEPSRSQCKQTIPHTDTDTQNLTFIGMDHTPELTTNPAPDSSLWRSSVGISQTPLTVGHSDCRRGDWALRLFDRAPQMRQGFSPVPPIQRL